MKKIICLLVSFIALFAIMGVVALETRTEGEIIDRGTIFVNGVEIETEDTILIAKYFLREITFEEMLFPLRTILEALGSTVYWEDETRSIFFDFAGVEYVAQLRRLDHVPGLEFIFVNEVKNPNSRIELHLDGGVSGFRMINNRIYLIGRSGLDLLEALGCRVEIDIENRILRIYSY